MFEVKHVLASSVKSILEICKDVSSTVTFHITRDHITANILNSSRVSILNIRLQSEFFCVYRYVKSIAIGVDLDPLLRTFKSKRPDSSVNFRVNEDVDVLVVEFESPSKPDRISSYELQLLDLNYECYDIPETGQYSCVADLNSVELIQALKDQLIFGDTVSINATTDKSLTVSTNGITVNSSSKLKPNTMFCVEDVSMPFSLKYILWFAKCTRFSRDITLSISPGLPLELKCYSKNTFAELRYYVAGKEIEEIIINNNV